jgi:hypothetical protein
MTSGERALRVSERVYRALLVAYPKEFRRVYGAQVMQVFRDLCREERRRSGTFGLARLWFGTLLDLAATAFVERSRLVKWRLLMPLALIVGLLIALVDSSPGWDDTGISAAAVFASCGILGALHPVRAWQWALAVGLWIPVLGIALHQNYESWMALAVALTGDYGEANEQIYQRSLEIIRCAFDERMVVGGR